MAVAVNYDKVFAPFPYESVTKDAYAIRRYRKYVYTKWEQGKFVDFVYAIDGAALFEEKKGTLTNGSGAGYKGSYVYAVEMARQNCEDSDYKAWLPVPAVADGYKIVCNYDPLDPNNGRKYTLCHNGTFIQDIYLLYRAMLPNSYNMSRTYADEKEESSISAVASVARLSLDNVEYKYLHRQLQHIQSQRDHGIQCVLSDYDLRVLQHKTQERFEELGRMRACD